MIEANSNEFSNWCIESVLFDPKHQDYAFILK